MSPHHLFRPERSRGVAAPSLIVGGREKANKSLERTPLQRAGRGLTPVVRRLSVHRSA